MTRPLPACSGPGSNHDGAESDDALRSYRLFVGPRSGILQETGGQGHGRRYGAGCGRVGKHQHSRVRQTILCSTNSCSSLNTAGNALYVGCLYSTPNGFTDGGANSQTVTIECKFRVAFVSAGHYNSILVHGHCHRDRASAFPELSGIEHGYRRGAIHRGPRWYRFGDQPLYLHPLHQAPRMRSTSETGRAVTTSSCGIYVNSNASTAMLVTGGASVTSSIIDVVGGVTKNNGKSTSSTPTTGVAAAADPFVNLGVPSVSGGCISGTLQTGRPPSTRRSLVTTAAVSRSGMA